MWIVVSSLEIVRDSFGKWANAETDGPQLLWPGLCWRNRSSLRRGAGVAVRRLVLVLGSSTEFRRRTGKDSFFSDLPENSRFGVEWPYRGLAEAVLPDQRPKKLNQLYYI